MARTTKNIVLSGEAASLSEILLSLAKLRGWENGDDETYEEVALESIKRFIFDSIRSYHADEAHKTAVRDASTSSDILLNNITLTLE